MQCSTNHEPCPLECLSSIDATDNFLTNCQLKREISRQGASISYKVKRMREKNNSRAFIAMTLG